jgi:hypothetical protein
MTQYSGNLPPDSQSKYRRPRRLFSWWGLLIGLTLGVGGGLYWAWERDPRVEFNTEPWQLNEADRASYMVAIAIQYSYDSNLGLAINRLLELRSPGDPIQEMADVACKLATTGYVENASGLRAVRAMMTFYQLQGRTGCADQLILLNDQVTPQLTIEAATPTLRPPPTKTPTPQSIASTPTPPAQVVFAPTIEPRTDYIVADVRTFCSSDPALAGIIEVRVQDFNSNGIPGVGLLARWNSGDSRFFTGLKPERGPEFADFEMEAGKSYTVEVINGSDPTQALVADPCITDAGEESITSYRVYFRPR